MIKKNYSEIMQQNRQIHPLKIQCQLIQIDLQNKAQVIKKDFQLFQKWLKISKMVKMLKMEKSKTIHKMTIEESLLHLEALKVDFKVKFKKFQNKLLLSLKKPQ